MRFDAEPERGIQYVHNQWNDLQAVSLQDPLFFSKLQGFARKNIDGLQLDDVQQIAFENVLSNLVCAYSRGSFVAYQTFRLPAGERYVFTTNMFGSLADYLSSGRHIFLKKPYERWLSFKFHGGDWSAQSVESNYVMYVKLFAGESVFRNYFSEISFEESRIIFAKYDRDGPKPASETQFFPTSFKDENNQFVSEERNYPNMGVLSQKRLSFLSFENTIDTVRRDYGSVTLADCYLFLKRTDADSYMPIIVRFYWEPKGAIWLPDDLVVCNTVVEGRLWPIF